MCAPGVRPATMLVFSRLASRISIIFTKGYKSVIYSFTVYSSWLIGNVGTSDAPLIDAGKRAVMVTFLLL